MSLPFSLFWKHHFINIYKYIFIYIFLWLESALRDFLPSPRCLTQMVDPLEERPCPLNLLLWWFNCSSCKQLDPISANDVFLWSSSLRILKHACSYMEEGRTSLLPRCIFFSCFCICRGALSLWIVLAHNMKNPGQAVRVLQHLKPSAMYCSIVAFGRWKLCSVGFFSMLQVWNILRCCYFSPALQQCHWGCQFQSQEIWDSKVAAPQQYRSPH